MRLGDVGCLKVLLGDVGCRDVRYQEGDFRDMGS